MSEQPIPRRPGVPLKDRTNPARTPQRERRAPVRHCFVDYDGTEHEGLVLAWAQDDNGWTALVCLVTEDGVVIQAWTPASALRPAR